MPYVKDILMFYLFKEPNWTVHFPPQQQFNVPGYRQYRKDCTSRMGGIMAHIRDDLPQRRRDDLEWEESDNTNEGRD